MTPRLALPAFVPAFVLALTASLWAMPADAMGPLRCDGKIIRPGVPVGYVIEKCGRPEYRIVESGPVRAGTLSGFSRVIGRYVSEQWIYDRGFGRFPAVLIFDHGRLKRIDYLPERSGYGD